MLQTKQINVTANVKAILDAANYAAIRTLINVEDGADVTDATNVAAAGAVMEGDTSTASMSFVVDEDNMASNSATKLSTQQSIKAYADTKLALGGGTMTGAIVTADHGTATNPEVVAVVYGTGSPPTANTTPIGTIFVKYTE